MFCKSCTKTIEDFVQLLLSEYLNNYLTNGKYCAIICIQGERNTETNKGEN